MNCKNFIKDKIIGIIIVIFTICTIEIFMIPFKNQLWVHIYVAISILLAYFIIIFIEYINKKTFYNEILKNLKTLDQKYLITEMIKTPKFQEGKILKEILNETEKSMVEHVNEYKFSQEEYKEYIELWIHEIKTPISVSKMIIENNPNEITNSIDEEIEKIDGFVEQALYYARSNHTEKDYIIKENNLSDIINEIIVKHKKTFITQKIKINIYNLENEVYTDRKWISFIINQIIENSIKYRKENPEIEIYSNKTKEKIELYIKDNGIGIQKKELEKVFKKGFTGTNGRKISKSTGIGLYLCKKLCNKLGHAIQIYSNEGKGTTVKIIFPFGSYSQFK